MKPKSTPFILVSNDDGIHAPGIRALIKAMKKIAHVVVVAPDREQSATSHSITLHRPLRVHHVAKDEYAVDGTPTDCVTLAIHEILKKKPDLIVSGINRGANLGDDVHYSGTVSVAVEAALCGIPAIAFSLVIFGEDEPHFETAARFATKLIKKYLSQKLPPRTLLNVNVPNLPEKQVKGVVATKLGKRNYGEVIFKKKDPRGRTYYWIGGDDRTFHQIPESDGEAIQQKKISVTPLSIDMTHKELLERLKLEKL